MAVDLEGLDTLNALLVELENVTQTIRVRAAKAPDPNSAEEITPPDIVECDFPGYGAIEVKEWTPVPWEDPTYAEVISEDLVFEAEAITTPQWIVLLYLTIQPIGGAETIRQIFVLPQPILMSIPGQRFTRRIRFRGYATP